MPLQLPVRLHSLKEASVALHQARNATDAGAAGVIIYNQAANVNAAPPGMADDGINGAFVTIPTVSIRRADGLAIIAQLGGTVTARIGLILRFAPEPMLSRSCSRSVPGCRWLFNFPLRHGCATQLANGAGN